MDENFPTKELLLRAGVCDQEGPPKHFKLRRRDNWICTDPGNLRAYELGRSVTETTLRLLYAYSPDRENLINSYGDKLETELAEGRFSGAWLYRILNDLGVDLNRPLDLGRLPGWTILLCPSQEEALRFLLQIGMDPTACFDESGGVPTPYDMCAQRGRFHVLEMVDRALKKRTEKHGRIWIDKGIEDFDPALTTAWSSDDMSDSESTWSRSACSTCLSDSSDDSYHSAVTNL